MALWPLDWLLSHTLQDHSVPLLHTEYLPFTENSTERGRKGSSQRTPDRHTSTGESVQLNIINSLGPHVMDKTPKTSPELISKTPNTTQLTQALLKTVKVMKNKQNLRDGYNLKSQND